MRLGLLLAFMAFPLIELAVLIKVGQLIGVWPTLGIIIATAILGLFILRWQGFTMLRRTTEALNEGRAPVEPVVNGALVFTAGALLITPGLIADTVGLILLIPWVRTQLARWGLGEFSRWGAAKVRIFRVDDKQAPGSSRERPRREGPIIEGDFRRLNDTEGDGKPKRRG